MPNEADLIATEHKRRQAMIDDDFDTLEEMTADSFYYAHINGMVEDRAAFFARLRAFAVKTIFTSARDIMVTLRPGYALLSGLSRIDFEWADGRTGSVETLFLSVWEPEGEEWRISAYSSSPLPRG